MNEAEARAEHVDPALKAAGLGVDEASRVCREYCIAPGRIEGRGKHGRPIIADYLLVFRNTLASGENAAPVLKCRRRAVAQ